MVKKELDIYFLKKNSTIYEKRGMEWFVIDGHYWIELRVYNRERRNSLLKTNLTSNNFNTGERFLITD